MAIVGIVEELGSFETVCAKMEVCDGFGEWFGGRKPDVKVSSLEVHSEKFKENWSGRPSHGIRCGIVIVKETK